MTASMAPQGPTAVLRGWRRSEHRAEVRACLVPVPCVGRGGVSAAAAPWHRPGTRVQGTAARYQRLAAPHPHQGVASGVHHSATRLRNCGRVPLCFVFFIFNMNTVHGDNFFFSYKHPIKLTARLSPNRVSAIYLSKYSTHQNQEACCCKKLSGKRSCAIFKPTCAVPQDWLELLAERPRCALMTGIPQLNDTGAGLSPTRVNSA